MTRAVSEIRPDAPPQGMTKPVLRYALITPARNEEHFIRHTLDSVVRQTRPPVKWLIVSDGSTDGTDAIIADYERQYDWIELMRMSEHRDRSFAAKAQCFNTGFERIRSLTFDVIGSLDADISFDSNYFDFLLRQFEANSRLGVAGAPFREDGRQYNFTFSNIEHVSGACQLFRRKCFDDIGGYLPLRCGGIDWAAVTTARMKGWQTRTFLEVTSEHHRRMGTASNTKIAAMFKYGRKDYDLGGHPLWQLVRSAYQLTKPPYIVGGLCLFAGYFAAMLRNEERAVGPELIRFHRAEQMNRLKAFATKLNGGSGAPA